MSQNFLQWVTQYVPEHWFCFIYQYTIGGAFFLFCVIAALRCQTLNFKTKNGRITLSLIIGGFIMAMSIHAIWIYYVAK